MKEPPYFDGISLDLTFYLRWAETLEDYFETKRILGWRDFVDSYLNSKIIPNIGLNTWGMREIFKTNLESRVGLSLIIHRCEINLDKHFKEESLKEKSIVT